jgi:phosphoribosyl-AMP cyclohydrolase
MDDLKSLENSARGTAIALEQFLDHLQFNDRGLMPAIAQDHENKNVLMLAWMDRHAIERTLNEGIVTYYSRSRQSYWKKGETSGHIQRLINMSFDCDADAILLLVQQTGEACHTFRRSCFYFDVRDEQIIVNSDPGIKRGS